MPIFYFGQPPIYVPPALVGLSRCQRAIQVCRIGLVGEVVLELLE
jgi:hypothetical protein